MFLVSLSSSLSSPFSHRLYSTPRSRTVTVLLWTLIVLGIAIHFQGILLTNDLSERLTPVFSMGHLRNVKLTCPYSTIHSFCYLCLRRDHSPSPRLVRALSFRILTILRVLTRALSRLLFGLRKANPISTRIELGCLGLDGILWLGAIIVTIPFIHFLRYG